MNPKISLLLYANPSVLAHLETVAPNLGTDDWLIELGPTPGLSLTLGYTGLSPDYLGLMGLLSPGGSLDDYRLETEGLMPSYVGASVIQSTGLLGAALTRLRQWLGPRSACCLCDYREIGSWLSSLAQFDDIGLAWDLAELPGPELLDLADGIARESTAQNVRWAGLFTYLGEESAVEASSAVEAQRLVTASGLEAPAVATV